MKRIDWYSPVEIDQEIKNHLGIVAAWTFSERSGGSVFDIAGSRLTGTLTTGSNYPGRRFFKSHQVGSLQFADGYVSVPNAAPLYPNSATFTFGCWFRRTGASGATLDALMRNRDVDSGNATNQYGLYVRPGTGEVFAEAGGSGSYSFTQGGAHTLNEWHSIACVVTNSSPYLTLYLDGASVATSTTNPGTVNQNSAFPFLFARHQSDSTQYFQGQITLPFVANKSWNAAQVDLWHNNPFILYRQPRRKTYFASVAAPAGNRRRRIIIAGRAA